MLVHQVTHHSLLSGRASYRVPCFGLFQQQDMLFVIMHVTRRYQAGHINILTILCKKITYRRRYLVFKIMTVSSFGLFTKLRIKCWVCWMVGVMHRHGVSDTSQHELVDVSHCKGLQPFFSPYCWCIRRTAPQLTYLKIGCVPCSGAQSVCHMMGRQMTHWCYAVHAHLTQGGSNVVPIRLCKGHPHHYFWFTLSCIHISKWYGQ